MSFLPYSIGASFISYHHERENDEPLSSETGYTLESLEADNSNKQRMLKA